MLLFGGFYVYPTPQTRILKPETRNPRSDTRKSTRDPHASLRRLLRAYPTSSAVRLAEVDSSKLTIWYNPVNLGVRRSPVSPNGWRFARAGHDGPHASLRRVLRACPTLDCTRGNCMKKWLQSTTSQVGWIHFWRRFSLKFGKSTFATALRRMWGEYLFRSPGNPETRHLRPESRNQTPKALNTKPEICHLTPRPRNPNNDT